MKSLFCILAIVVFMPFASIYAQNNAKGLDIRLGKVKPTESDGKKIVPSTITTQKEILANPKLIVAEHGYEVTGFTFSMLPRTGDHKKDEYLGPFKTKGNKLTEKIISLIEKYPAANIYIDSIDYKPNGGQGNYAKPIFYSYKN